MKQLYFVIPLYLLIAQHCKPPDPIESDIQTFVNAHLDTDADVRIAVGSCNRHDLPQPLWDDINNHKPTAWIWLGDIIYGDSKNMDVIQKKYEAQSAIKDYAQLVESSSIYGIWDDHDYGKNNAGKEFEKKAETRDLLFNFLNVPSDDSAWSREGAYQSYKLEHNDITIKLILLDCRYFRDEAKKLNGKYQKIEGYDILGEDQWSWLAQELSSNDVDIHFIANGIQVIPEDHKYEKWANFPSSRKRLFDLLSKHQPNIPILLSGDRHISEVSAITLEGYDEPLYEITSSGLTHPWATFPGEENRHRIGEVINVRNYGLFNIKKKKDNSFTILYQVFGDNNTLLQELQLFNQ